MIADVDTGDGPNLVRMSFRTEEMREQVEPSVEENLRSANNAQIKVVGLITLIVQIGNSIVPVQFGVIDELVTSVFLWTDYINKHVRMMVPTKMKLVPNNSTPLSILAVGIQNEPVTVVEQQDSYGLTIPSTEIIQTLQKQRSEDPEQPVSGLRSERRIVRAAKFIRISPRTESKTIIKSKEAGLWYLESHPDTVRLGCSMIARGMMEIVPKTDGVTHRELVRYGHRHTKGNESCRSNRHARPSRSTGR